MKSLLYISVSMFILASCKQVPEPEALQPVPQERQLAWHELEFYAFVHFSINTFTNLEWGSGGESAELFNPSELDCRQWARVARDAGMKGIILTTKHHDGFCLWPSEYTEHSVKNSPWKGGKGDVVRELAHACQEYGLKLGLYLSPWDRNHADYGSEAYITYFRKQLTELLTNYGEVFEVWFDGANGGTGWYGGANEERRVDRKTYYDWPNTHKLVHELQPNAVMFSDAGPGVRWIGNEKGWAGETNWSMLRRDEFYPGSGNHEPLIEGHEDGTHWLPGEVDVSIRPGWFYHRSDDHKVKTVKHLVDIYYESIGRNASLLLNLPVDHRGLVHENDVDHLMRMVEVIKADLDIDLASGVQVEADQLRGESRNFGAQNAVDGDPQTYWSTDDDITSASVVMDFGEEITFNRFLAREYIPLGQRVREFSIEALVDGDWREIEHQTTIGNKRILRFDDVSSSQLRFNILDSRACPCITTLSVYHAPKLLEPPAIARDKQGSVTLGAFDSGLDIYYTTDGSDPDPSSRLFKKPFTLKDKGEIRALAHDPLSGRSSEVSLQEFDICKELWTVVNPKPSVDKKGKAIVDSDPATVWRTSGEEPLPAEVIVDLGEELTLAGFTYLPTQGRYIHGTITHYRFYVSRDGRSWGDPVSSGEFGNIRNSPILQEQSFDPVQARYIKLIADQVVKTHHTRRRSTNDFASIAELGVISQ